MSIALNPSSTFEYVLKSDRQADNPPVFIIKILSANQSIDVSGAIENMASLSSGSKAIAEYREKLKPVLVGWRNVRDGSGNDVAFDRDVIGDHTSWQDVQELCNAALVGSEVSAEDLGKSESQ